MHSVTVTGAGIAPLTHDEEITYEVAEQNRQITIEDDQYTFDPSWQINWSEAGTEHTNEYTLDVATGVTGDACASFTNTATIVETEQASSADFSVCGKNGEVVPPVVVPPTDGNPALPALPTLTNTGGTSLLGISIGAIVLVVAGGLLVMLRARRRKSDV